MSTYIHGIGASENIDTSGEIVSIAGLDISSLDKDGVFNYEHKSDLPAQVVGKILKARKIFSDADCEDEHQEYFWNKCKVPYLYVMGELLDDYSDSAREVAARFRYDTDKKAQNERAMMNFSVEGSKISKEGITVSRSIARKITITILPCNKAAVAEMVAVAPGNPKKNQIDELFKTEGIEIEVLTIDKNSKLWNLLKKEDPNKHATKLGIKPFKKDMGGGQSSNLASTALSGVGPTSGGGLLAASEKGPKLGVGKGVKVIDTTPKPAFTKLPVVTSAVNSSKKPLAKALTAGGGIVAPDKLEGGAALGKEELEKTAGQSGVDPQSGHDPGTVPINKPLRSKDSRMQVTNPKISTGGHLGLKKSQWLMRAEADYKVWSKREAFEQFMSQRLPNLSRGEIQVIGQTMLLQKALKQEKALAKVAPSQFQHSVINKNQKK